MKYSSSVPGAILRALALVLPVLLAGCQALLPDTRTELGVSWHSYDEARAAIGGLEPFVTRIEEVRAAGIDPVTNPSITILSYSDLLQRFAAGSALRPDDFDPGIRQCLTAGKACVGYLIQIRRVHRERVGNFWLDSLAFRRETNVTGWSFNALVLMVDDIVVYTLHGGQPAIHEREIVRNPLGPLQAWGEQAPRFVR